MKKIKLVCGTLLLIVMTLSCKEEKKADTGTSQMKQVMAIHDEVMPKMSVFGKLVEELKSKEDTTATGQQYKAAREDLQAAHKSMMDWMQGFGDRFNSDEILNGKSLSAEKQQWLDEEEEKIKAVREQINSSIEMAEALLEDPN